mgnify:FL=1
MYFRHLYHILKFVRYSEAQYFRYSSNHSQQADIHKKYREYVQFVQAQMSTAELKLLFYNSFLFPKMQELINSLWSIREFMYPRFMHERS